MNIPKLLIPKTGIEEKTEEFLERKESKNEPTTLRDVLEKIKKELEPYYEHKLIIGKYDPDHYSTPYLYIAEEKELTKFYSRFRKKKSWKRKIIFLIHESVYIDNTKNEKHMNAYLTEDIYNETERPVRKHTETYAKTKGFIGINIHRWRF